MATEPFKALPRMGAIVPLRRVMEVGLIFLTHSLVCRGCLKKTESGAVSRLSIVTALGDERLWRYKGRLAQSFLPALSD